MKLKTKPKQEKLTLPIQDLSTHEPAKNTFIAVLLEADNDLGNVVTFC